MVAEEVSRQLAEKDVEIDLLQNKIEELKTPSNSKQA